MREFDFLGMTVDVQPKMGGMAHWWRKETPDCINKVAVDTQPTVRLSAQKHLTVATEVSVRMEHAYGPAWAGVSPCANHEGAVEVGLRANEHFIHSGSAEELVGRCLNRQFGKENNPHDRQRK